MNILSNIIRGGQLSLHAIRMFKQVLRWLFLWWLVVFCLMFSVVLYQNTTVEQWGGYKNYQWANFLSCIMMSSSEVSVYFGSLPSKITAHQVLTSSYFISIKEEVEDVMLRGIRFSFKCANWVAVLVSIYFIRRGFRRTGEEFKRGARLSSFDKVKGDIQKANNESNYNAYLVASMPYPFQAEMQQTFVIGANGTGKTILISDIVEQIRKRGDKAIIYDKKGDYTKWFYNSDKDKILNPFDTRGEEWNLLSEIDHIGNIKQIAKAFIPDKNVYGENNKIWDEAARIAFTGIVEKFFSKDQDLSNREIVDMILRQDMKKVAKLVKDTYAQSTLDMNSPKTAASVMFVLASHFNSLRLCDGKRNNSFSIRDWVKEEDRDSFLFITSQENLSSELAPLQTAWIEIVISSILDNNEEEKKKTWVIIDELPTLQKIPSLANGLAVARSYQGCFVLGMQNIAQMRDKYGRDLTQDINSECNTKCIFKSNDPDTAKWMADNIGEAETKEYKEGLSYGANTMRDGVNISAIDKIKPLFLPSEIQSMPRLSLILKMPDNSAVKARVKYKKREVNAKAFIEDQKILANLKEIYAQIEDEKDNENEESCETEESEEKGKNLTTKMKINNSI